MKDIYMDRASKIDGKIDSLLDEYQTATDGDTKNQILHDIKVFSDIDNNLAKTLVAIEANELKSKEITLAEVTSNERHEVDLKELEARAEERSLREKENEIRNREVDIRSREVEIKSDELKHSIDKDAADKEVSEAKLEVEKQAVLGRVAGEGLKVLGTVVGVAGTLVSLKAVMKFEKSEDGGILPSKLMSLIFKNL